MAVVLSFCLGQQRHRKTHLGQPAETSYLRPEAPTYSMAVQLLASSALDCQMKWFRLPNKVLKKSVIMSLLTVAPDLTYKIKRLHICKLSPLLTYVEVEVRSLAVFVWYLASYPQVQVVHTLVFPGTPSGKPEILDCSSYKLWSSQQFYQSSLQMGGMLSVIFPPENVKIRCGK